MSEKPSGYEFQSTLTPEQIAARERIAKALSEGKDIDPEDEAMLSKSIVFSLKSLHKLGTKPRRAGDPEPR